jgi:hypothetical protein
MKLSRQMRLLTGFTLLALTVTFVALTAASNDKQKITAYGALQMMEGAATKTGATPLALKVAKAIDEKGESLDMLDGQTIRLAGQKSLQAIAKKHKAGDGLMIKGSLNAKEKILTILSYKAVGSSGSGTK